MSSQVALATTTSRSRPLAKFHPTVWGDYFAFFPPTNSELESCAEDIEELKEKVKAMLLTYANDLIENIMHINSLCRLGVSYHFEKEIKQKLQSHYLDAQHNNHDYDLYTCALVFRVFRQHGYKMSCEMFDKFKGGDRKFKEILASDVRGILSLYEAAHVRVHGEDILEEALEFTKTHIEFFVRDHPRHPLTRQLLQALEQPLHRGMPRLEARRYISFYQEDTFRNETLLKFAILDFNRVQLLHRQELSLITRWHMELKLDEKLSYVRNRIVESYFWMLGIYFEPHYSRARIIVTKIFTILSIVDDTYDSYATFEELQCFTNAIRRWDASMSDQLPDYMKFIYRTILNLYENLENEMTKEGRLYSIDYARDALKEIVDSYHNEAKWFNGDYVPRFEEYMKNALVSSGGYLMPLSSFVGMIGVAEKDAFDWFQTRPKCVRACEVVARLLNDSKSHKAEQERGHVASSIECYMSEYGVSEEEALEAIQVMIENAWKDLNEECINQRPVVSTEILMRILNMTRSMDVFYKFGDGYTNSNTNVKDYITLILIDPIVEK